MRSAKLAVLVAVAALLCLPGAPAAQEDVPEAQRYQNVTWYEVVHVDYKPGKAEEALDLVEEHFLPAVEASGNPGPVMELVHTTGEWDATIIWELDEGPSELTWSMPPEGVAFQQAMVELAGSQEEARQIFDRYQSYISRSEVTLARTPERDGAEGGEGPN